MKKLNQSKVNIGGIVVTTKELRIMGDKYPIPKGHQGKIISVKKNGKRLERFSVEWRLDNYVVFTNHDLQFNRTILKITGLKKTESVSVLETTS